MVTLQILKFYHIKAKIQRDFYKTCLLTLLAKRISRLRKTAIERQNMKSMAAEIDKTVLVL